MHVWHPAWLLILKHLRFGTFSAPVVPKGSMFAWMTAFATLHCGYLVTQINGGPSALFLDWVSVNIC